VDDDSSSHDNVAKTVTVRVECIVQGSAPADEGLDPLLVYAVKKLVNNAALIAAVDVREAGIQWATESDYEDVAGAAIDFELDFGHNYGDPTQ
jgi:hypothetical protein